MAFCPHCGKSVGEQASRCAECGGELEARGRGVRFKGTMMMSPGTAPLIQPPAGAQPKPATTPPVEPAPAASIPGNPATAATMPLGQVLGAANAATQAAGPDAPKNLAALKATMLGTGLPGGGLGMPQGRADAPGARPAAAAAAPQPQQPPIAAPVQAAPAVAESTAAHQEPAPAPVRPRPAPAQAAQPAQPAQEDDSKRFLVGDPMAPSTLSKGQRATAPSRLSQDIPRDRTPMWIAIGIAGVLVITSLGYLAARLMGLAD